MGSAQLNSKITFSQSGQGILEVIVTIGIGTIMVLALVVLSVRANKSSDFSKASSQASNLASQGIEVINNLKNVQGVDSGTNLFKLDGNNCTGVSATLVSWTGIFGNSNYVDDTTCPAGQPGRIGYIVNNSIVGTCPVNDNCVYFQDTPSNYGSVTVDNQIYSRVVYLADIPVGSGGKSNCNNAAGDWNLVKQFTVDVSWNDSSGTHHQTQTSCIGIN